MGDDTACSVNDLPKVTSIISSESVSKPEAFDMMVRFLSKHQFQYPGNIHNPQQQNDQNHQDFEQPRFGRVYHFWEDLYHVAETLAVRNRDSTLHSQQQEILRKLRLVAAPLHTEEVHNDVVIKVEQEVVNNENDVFLVPPKGEKLMPDEDKIREMVIKQEEEDVQHQHRKSARKNKKEKKKDKKRKRESMDL